MKKIDWKKVWSHFNKWYSRDPFKNSAWDIEQKKIQSIVESQLKPNRKRK